MARDEEALIPTVGRVAKKLRAELGERRSALQSTSDLTLSITPSFDAYKAWARGRALLYGNENRAAVTWFRTALALDPDYASAWKLLGYAFGNLDEPDSALAAFRSAAAHPQRLTTTQKLGCEVEIAFLTGDLASALAASERQVQLEPESWTAHNDRSAYLGAAGRFVESLECAKTAEKVSPFGASQQVLYNQFWDLLFLHRVNEARSLVPRITGGFRLEAPMHLAAAAERWSAAESLATLLRITPSADDDARRAAATVLAAAQSARGEVRKADQTLRQAQVMAETAHDAAHADWIRWDRLRLVLFSRGVAADPGSPGGWDDTTSELLTRGVWAAAAGDTALARRLLATSRKRSALDLARQGFAPAVLEGWIASRTGRWEDVIRILGPSALQGETRGYSVFQSAPVVRWLVAEAHEQLNHPDSAAVYFERAIAPAPDGGTNMPQIRMASSFAHRRLVLLYSRAGRLDEARRHWEIFSKTFAHPDQEMVPLVEEARAALASAEAQPRSAHERPGASFP